VAYAIGAWAVGGGECLQNARESHGRRMMRSPSEPITYMEEDLIQRSRAGDSDAFAALVEEHRDAMYHLAWRMVGSPEDAADLVQEAFVRAYRSLDRFEGRSSFRTWVHRITVHC